MRATRRPLRRLNLVAALGGWVAGWLLRPNPLGAARLLYVQIFELARVKQAGVHLAFGKELGLLDLHILRVNFLYFFLLWAVGAIVFLLSRRRRLQERWVVPAWSAFALSVISFLMMFFVARRAEDLWITFAVVFLAFVAAVCVIPWVRAGKRGLVVEGAALAVFLALAGNSLALNSDSYLRRFTVPPDYLREGCTWLRNHAAPGDVVCHLSWDVFPYLFYWDRTQRYIGGMDPIFQYAYSPDLYWKLHHLAQGETVGATSGDPVFTPKHMEAMHTVFVRDFHARYLLLVKHKDDRRVYDFCLADAGFEPVYEDGECVIFRVLPAGAK